MTAPRCGPGMEAGTAWAVSAGLRREGKDAMTEISVKTKLWGLIAIMLLLITMWGP